MSHRIIVTGTAILVLALGLGLALAKANFTGTWVMDKSKSEGNIVAAEQTMTITQDGDTLTLQNKMTTDEGELLINDSYVINGKEVDFTQKRNEIIGKGNKRRTISLSPEALAHFLGTPHTLGSDLIFCRDGGVQFEEAASDFSHFRRLAQARATKAKQAFIRFRFHDLRHLFAVEALRGGMGLYDLSKHLGHTSVKTTEWYLDFLPGDEAQRAKEASAQNPARPLRFSEASNG